MWRHGKSGTSKNSDPNSKEAAKTHLYEKNRKSPRSANEVDASKKKDDKK